MAYNTAQVTDAGNALFAQILANKSSLSIDKIEISNVQLAASTVLTSMTKIDNVVQTTGANGLQKSGNSFIISTAVSNASVTADYQAWVFGIWGSDSTNGTSTLIEVITTTGTPDTIPAYSGSTPVTYNYKFATALSNASGISLSMSNDAYATNDTVLHTSGDETSTGTKTFEKIEVSNDSTPDVVLTDGASISLDNGESKFTPANDSTVVHTTGDETIDGQKKFKTDPTDSAGNAYAKTVDVNQQLDKKVNVSDMRKPASDVAGIEEVNAKQDKIGYTPANDSKVAHLSGANNFDTVPTVNNNPLLLASSLPSDLARTGADNAFTGANSFDQDPVDKDGIAYRSGGPNLAPGTSGDWQTFSGEGWVNTFTSGKITGLESGNTYTATTEYRNNTVPIKIELYGYDKNNAPIIKDYVQSAIVRANSSGKLTLTFTNTFSDSAYFMLDIAASNTQTTTQSYEYRHVKIEKGSTSTPWEPSNYDVLTRVIDNGDGSIKVNGNSYTPANDSKVAHLSGANNFDTVPTVNNSPLLLASSLPSDLARTGSDQEFTGKNTFDTAPIDKTTGNPYITKDGVPAVPSTLADTTKPANFQAGLQSGGVSVATSDDLKSVENSAWHQLSMPDCNGMEGITLLYRNFISDHYINLYAYGNAIQSNINGPTMLDLSSLIDNIESVSGMARDLTVRISASIFRDSSGEETLVDLVASGNKLTLGTNATIFMAGPVQINGHDSPFAKVTYDNWIGS